MNNKKESTFNEQLASLYLEQIKYLRQENISIQDKFLAGTTVYLAAFGIFAYYLEGSTEPEVKALFLILPFLYFSIPYNLVKYTSRMMAINGYLKQLEGKLNEVVQGNIFIWYRELINISALKGGFAVLTTPLQLPIHLVSSVYIINRFIDTIKTDTIYTPYHPILEGLLVATILGVIYMIVNAGLVQNKVIARTEEIWKTPTFNTPPAQAPAQSNPAPSGGGTVTQGSQADTDWANGMVSGGEQSGTVTAPSEGSPDNLTPPTRE